MAKRWSKLQKDLYLLFPDNLPLQVQCRLYRMDSQRGSTSIPRYWFTLGKEIIWDYPKDFKATVTAGYPYVSSISDISNMIRDYINTPTTDLMTVHFSEDQWSLIDLLRAADRRLGKRRLIQLRENTNSKAVRMVIDARLNKTLNVNRSNSV